MKKIVLILLVFLSTVKVAMAAYWYVAPIGGSDTNLCSEIMPCRTYSRAESLASPGDTIYLRGGNFPASFVSTVNKSGVTIKNYPNETPVIDHNWEYPRWTGYPNDMPTALYTATFTVNGDDVLIEGITMKNGRGIGIRSRGDRVRIRYNNISQYFHNGISMDLNADTHDNEVAYNTVTRCNFIREIDGGFSQWSNLSTNIAIRGEGHWVHHNISRFAHSSGLELLQALNVVCEYNLLYGNGITQFHSAENRNLDIRYNLMYGVARPPVPAPYSPRNFVWTATKDGDGSADLMCEIWRSQDHNGIPDYWDHNVKFYGNLIANTVNGIRLGWQLGSGRESETNTVREFKIYSNTVINPIRNDYNSGSIYGHTLVVMGNLDNGIQHIGAGNVIKNNIFWSESDVSHNDQWCPPHVDIGYNLWNRAPAASYQSSTDPRYPSYAPLDMTEYFRRTIWNNLQEGDITRADAELLISAAHAIGTGDADDFFRSLSIPYSGRPDMGAIQTAGGTANEAPVATVSAPIGPQSIPVGGSLSFDGTISDADSGTDWIHCLWDFDGVRQQWSADGESPRNCNVGSVTFPTQGTYNVTFRGTDNNGAASNTVTIPVTVGTPPAVPPPIHVYDFEAADITGDTGSANNPVTNNGGITTGGTEPSTPGYGATGAVLNGNNQSFTLPAATFGNAGLGGTDLDGTWYIGIRPASVSSVQFLMGVNTDAEEKLAIKLINNVLYLHWGYNNGDSYQSIPMSGAGLQVGRDYVIAFTKFSGGFYRLKCMDAVSGDYMTDITSLSTPLSGEPNTAQVDLAIGSRSDNEKHFSGNIWLTHIYDEPHSDAEMESIMENATSGSDIQRCYLGADKTYATGDELTVFCETTPTTVDQSGGTVSIELEAGSSDLVCDLQTANGSNVSLLEFRGTIQAGMTTNSIRINATANGIQLNGGSLGAIDHSVPMAGPGSINFESDGYIDTDGGVFTSMCGVDRDSENWDCLSGPLLLKRGERAAFKLCSDDPMFFSEGVIGNISVTVALSNGDDLVFQPVWGNSTQCWGFVSQEIETDMSNFASLRVTGVTAVVRDTLTPGSSTKIVNGAGAEMVSYDLPQLLIDAFNKISIMGGAYRFIDPTGTGSVQRQ